MISTQQTMLASLEAGKLRKIDDLEAVLEPVLELLFSEACVAIRLCTKIVEAVVTLPQDTRAATLAARALAAIATGSRTIGDMDQAEAALTLGMDIAEAFGLEPAAAELDMAGIYIHYHQGAFEAAVGASEVALFRFLALQDFTGVGKTLVARASALGALERYEESCLCYRAALDCLPENLVRYRYAALHNLGYSHFLKGDFAEAETLTTEAARFIPETDRHSFAALSWLRAKIALKHGRFGSADRFFSATLAAYEAIPEPMSAAMTTLDIVKAWLGQGRHEEACLQARSMLALLTPLRRYKALSAAIGELARAARLGNIQMTLVNHAAQELEKARSRD